MGCSERQRGSSAKRLCAAMGESKHLVPEECGEVEGTESALRCAGTQGRGKGTLKFENEDPRPPGVRSCPKDSASGRPQTPSGRHRQKPFASVSPTPTALLLHPPRRRGQRSRLEGGIGEGEVKQSLGEPSFLQAPGSGCPPSPWLDTWLQTSPSHPHQVEVMGQQGWRRAGWTLEPG